jgi:glycosyltransferase involved in cell wall biosynthesis
MKELSIIIPTYKNTQYLNECFFSLIKSIKDRDVEILVGIDACLTTLKFIKDNLFDNRIKFFFFKKNQGPYIIRNTLSKISNSENILFFDSDDIMCENMIDLIIEDLKTNLVVKPSYIEFNDGKEIDVKSKLIRSEGVFAINRDLLLNFNGFEPWVCAADTELSLRL